MQIKKKDVSKKDTYAELRAEIEKLKKSQSEQAAEIARLKKGGVANGY